MDAKTDPRARWSVWRDLARDLKRPGLVAAGVLVILIALVGAFGGWAPAAQGRLPLVGAGQTVNLGPWEVTFGKAMLTYEVEPWGARDPGRRYYVVTARVVSVVDEPVTQAAFEDVFAPLYDGQTIDGYLGPQEVEPEAGRADLRRMIGSFQPRLSYDVWLILRQSTSVPDVRELAVDLTPREYRDNLALGGRGWLPQRQPTYRLVLPVQPFEEP